MIELLVIAQLMTNEPQQPQQQNTYKPPAWQQPKTSAPSSVPSSKQIEEFERQIFEYPKG